MLNIILESNIRVTEIPERRERSRKTIWEDNGWEFFQITKDIKNPKQVTPRHINQTAENQRENLEGSRRKKHIFYTKELGKELNQTSCLYYVSYNTVEWHL